MNYPKNLDSALKWSYKFWSTQPVKKLNEITYIDGEIEHKNKEDILTESGLLIDGFEWSSINFDNDSDIKELTEFLDKHYIDDKPNNFRLHYSANLLKWMYQNTNYLCVAVRYKSDTNNSIVGIICGKVVKMQLNKNAMDVVNINLLCIHPKLRQKRLVPRLIKEITRQFNLKGYFHGIYTATTYLPTPVTTVKSSHRPLNIEKLVSTGFTRLPNELSIEQLKAMVAIKGANSKGFVKMGPVHLEASYDLFNQYMKKYNYHPIYTLKEFEHTFINNEFVTSYVMEDNNGNVIDFVSYRTLKYRVINSADDFINVAYLFYYTSINTTHYKLVNELLYVARDNHIDVFTAYDIMENESILRELGFEEGSGILHYYLYNWKTKPLKNNQLATLLF